MNGLTVEAKVCKVSDSGKSMLVGIKPNKYVIGLVFGWVANPDGLAKDAIIKDFPMPTGTTPCYNEDGKPILHTDGSPVVRFAF